MKEDIISAIKGILAAIGFIVAMGIVWLISKETFNLQSRSEQLSKEIKMNVPECFCNCPNHGNN